MTSIRLLLAFLHLGLVCGNLAPHPAAGNGPVLEIWAISEAATARTAQAHEFVAGMQTTATERRDAHAGLQSLEHSRQTRQGSEGESSDPVTHALVGPGEQVWA